MFKTSIICILTVIAIFPALSVSAQGLKSAAPLFQQVGSKSGADTYEHPQELVGAGINVALTLVGLIFLVLMIYAGYLWMTARGEEEPVNKAQKIITAAIIGFVLVASAYAITVFVGKRLEKGGGGTPTKEALQTDGAEPAGDPSKQVCCRVCKEKLLGDWYDEPDYLWISEAACKKACVGEDADECVAEAVSNISDPSDCTNADDQGFSCETYEAVLDTL